MTTTISKKRSLWAKLTKSKAFREAFVSSQFKRSLPFQIRVLREQRGWNQEQLAKECKLTQGVVSRAENPDYGNLTINTILRIASGFDVAFEGRFVPFSRAAGSFANMSEAASKVPSFKDDSIGASFANTNVVVMAPTTTTPKATSLFVSFSNTPSTFTTPSIKDLSGQVFIASATAKSQSASGA